MEMTPRERWLKLLAGETPDRIPTDYQATAEVTARLRRDLDCADDEALYRKLHIDARCVIDVPWRRPPDIDSRADAWGVVFREVSYGGGTYLEPEYQPLARARSVADIEAHRWPSCDEFDYSAIGPLIELNAGYRPVHAGCYEPLLLYGQMRGLQAAMEDLALRPELAEAALERIFAFHHEHHRRIFAAGKAAGEKGDSPHLCAAPSGLFRQMGTVPFFRGAGGIDLTWVAEDLGAQTGPLMSLAMYRRFLLPNQIKMADLARSYGVHVMYHTDGAARVFLPDLIDRVGIEILNPIQWRCPGMEREGLVADFGRNIIFHGSIDNQQTLPFGSTADVIEEVRQSVEIYRSARWICAPCHNLQPVSPTRNIVALYETIHELGKMAP